MLSDVIAALATPPGRGALALIRLSGPGSHDVAARVLDPFESTQAGRARRSRVYDPASKDLLDDVLYTVFAAPHSYTGEDMVEISTHGGALVPVEALGALYAAGARAAAPGEFTRRALQHGKMDLLQAEAVGDLVDATAPAQRRAALRQLDRGLSQRIEQLRGKVLELEALISYEIDFPEEDSGPVSPERVRAAWADVRADLSALIATSRSGERVRNGALTVIAGRPNVGKSSLFNALVGSERVIVTDVPGTTRDAVETPIECDGFPFRLVDTAGLRDTADQVEKIGIEVSRKYLDQADVIMLCVEAGDDVDDEARAFAEERKDRVVLVRTKSDLTTEVTGPGVAVSARTGQGLSALRGELVGRAFQDSQANLEPVLNRERHRVALAGGLEELDEFWKARDAGLEAVVAATHLRAAVLQLENVIGAVTNEDVLGRVFSSFCIGK